jgi:Holliday junction resolvasome RuvABC DNA-binding subunit
MAEKIILELKGKVTYETSVLKDAPTDSDTVDALSSLGYNPAEIAAVLPKIPVALTTSAERITWVLRHVGE